MDFKEMAVKVAFANFLRELMREQEITVQALGEKSGYTARNINNYLNPKQVNDKDTGKIKELPTIIPATFYNTMQTALNFQHQDFRNYIDNQQANSSCHGVKNVNITGGTFSQTVIGAKGDVHFHNDTDD